MKADLTEDSNRRIADIVHDNVQYWGGIIAFVILARIEELENKVSELDDAVTRIEGDVAQVGPAIQALRDEIAALGNTGADVTRLNAAADSLEAALAPPASPTP